MTPYMRLLARWYAGHHITAEEFWALGRSSLDYFEQQMRTDPVLWLVREQYLRASAARRV